MIAFMGRVPKPFPVAALRISRPSQPLRFFGMTVMRNFASGFSRTGLRLALLLTGALAAAGPAHGQRREAGDDEGYLSAEELKSDEKGRFQALQQGRQSPSPQEMAPGGLVDRAAQFYVYRVTWPW